MAEISALELLLSPWTHVSLISQVLLVVQGVTVLIGAVPAARKRLRQVHWFVALIVGPPLLWCLMEASLGLIMSWDAITVHSPPFFYDWPLRLGTVIGFTVLLQSLLAVQYSQDPLKAFPVFGVVIGILAIFADAIFLLLMVL